MLKTIINDMLLYEPLQYPYENIILYSNRLCMIISNLENYMVFRNLIHLVNVKGDHGHNIVKLKRHTHTYFVVFKPK